MQITNRVFLLTQSLKETPLMLSECSRCLCYFAQSAKNVPGTYRVEKPGCTEGGTTATLLAWIHWPRPPQRWYRETPDANLAPCRAYGWERPALQCLALAVVDGTCPPPSTECPAQNPLTCALCVEGRISAWPPKPVTSANPSQVADQCPGRHERLLLSRAVVRQVH